MPGTNEIVKANNMFAFDIYARLAKEPGNLVLSPFSIDTALAMTYAGAREDTARQIATGIHLPNGDTNVHAEFSALLKQLLNTNRFDNQFVIANSLWVQQGYPVIESFQKLLHDQYGSSLNAIDLTGWPGEFDSAKATAARTQINRWVANQTHDPIQEIIPAKLPGPDTRFMLVNTIRFIGLWEKPFSEALTTNAPFHPDSKVGVSVPTMHAKANFKYAEDDGVQMLELPYFGEQLSMILLLPKKADGFPELEKTLTLSYFEQLEQASYLALVGVSLPKFKQDSNYDLINSLKALGITDAFSEIADFSNITSKNKLFIEAVIHKAYVDVDEKGTEATAATTTIAATKGMPLQSSSLVLFNADHPFLFFIRHNPTGIILFMGRLTNPLQ